MTFAISKELQFLAGHSFRVKLTPMSWLVPLPRGVVYLPENSCKLFYDERNQQMRSPISQMRTPK
ncbi:hypothetical protein [Nostoc sp. CHAB 5715]|uniref:hypothetical protein n=1 Tax=Nostoc sp. CHAB 5715 TaxID=2780400 RepID=UPI001E5272C9|nr:hypothetical protein [Nostoc sp. CHAB 5715]MCC5619793.1 hypothetical protein [Nostoc sp. CHAB 5715]